jgi:hypothetical protein
MKTFNAMIAMAIVVVGTGFYRGWFAFVPDTRGATANISLATNSDKMKQDAKLVTDKATELTGGVMDDVKADGQANDNVMSNGL